MACLFPCFLQGNCTEIFPDRNQIQCDLVGNENSIEPPKFGFNYKAPRSLHCGLRPRIQREKVWSWNGSFPAPARLFPTMAWILFFSLSTQPTVNPQGEQHLQGPAAASPSLFLCDCAWHGTAATGPEPNQPWYRHGFQVSYFLLFETLKPQSQSGVELFSRSLQCSNWNRLGAVWDVKTIPSQNKASKALHKQTLWPSARRAQQNRAAFSPRLWYKLAMNVWSKRPGMRKIRPVKANAVTSVRAERRSACVNGSLTQTVSQGLHFNAVCTCLVCNKFLKIRQRDGAHPSTAGTGNCCLMTEAEVRVDRAQKGI